MAMAATFLGGTEEEEKERSMISFYEEAVNHELLYDVGNSSSKMVPQISTSDLSNNGNLTDTGTPPRERSRRKREIDRAYRERMKQGKVEMKTNLDTLLEENDTLNQENKSLKQDNVLMNEILKSQTKEIDQFKTEFDKMRYEYNKQNALVQRLSELLASPDLQLENQRLTFENAQLRQNASMNHKVSQLAEDNGRLKLENRVLKVQIDALCGKVINDTGKNHGEDLTR